jgi:hypothetical protein
LLIVPSGTPHWVRDGTVKFLAVKIRDAQSPIMATASYFEGSETFAKGGLLFDGKERNFRVFALKREKPGGVELHALNTDIVLILAGSATFLTGN